VSGLRLFPAKTPVWVLVCAAVLFASGIILPGVLAALQSDYSTSGNYLSELGAVGAPYATITKAFGFLPVAITSVMLLVYIAICRFSKRDGRIGAVLLMIGLSSGYLIAVLFPCDFGCPIEGSARQAVHNLAGLIQYPLGALGLIMMGAAMRLSGQRLGWLPLLSGAAMAVGFVMMLVPDQSFMRGAWQRLGDYSVIVLALKAGKQGAPDG
jgi:hypothetical membrane protein